MGVSPGQLTQANMPDNPEIWKAAAMADHFEKIQKLPDPVVGCPNFRRIPGCKVYCCGQPTAEGFKNCLEKVCGTIYPKDGKIIWLNMRQEPNVYVNGTPICARPPNKIGEYAELGAVTTAALNADEPEFMRVVEGRMKENADKLKYVDISKKEHEIEVKDLKTLDNVIEGLKESFPGLVHLRVPVCNSAAPSIADFDTICENLVGTGINTPIIINDQVGLSRYTMDAAKDPLFRGEFEVVKELVATLKDGVAAKNECDKVIDKNGTPKTGGTGIKQLRENIAESKLSYEIMDDAAQAFLKVKIMDNIHKYYYLIVFTAYMREASDLARNAVADDQKAALTLTSGKCAIPGDQLKLPRTFAAFMEENSGMRGLIDTGKGNLQWERDIPPAALSNLESLAKTDFKGNLGKIIHDIYQTAHTMFSDMPQGDHKKRAKYRFSSKTLMRILPTPFKGEVEELIEKKAITLDLYEILGQCTWGQGIKA